MTIDIGDRAPDFSLPDDAGTQVSLADFSGKGLVLYFYPKAFTPGCTTEACDFRDATTSLDRAGYAIAGVSPDPVAVLARFRREHRLSFPMLSDADHTVAAAYGAWGTKTDYGREYQGIIRSTFVIGADGLIERVWRNVKAKGHAGRLVAELVP
ncbi:MAG: peroxiredoxin [Actinobacteria bacterium RBG_16_68_21]|nr:MAG: peroxiredoxin [Actinobacteria bacterium RBG_16_68_21]